MQDCGAGVLGIKREQPVKQRQDAVRRGKLPQANSARSLSQDRLFSRRKGEVLSHHFCSHPLRVTLWCINSSVVDCNFPKSPQQMSGPTCSSRTLPFLMKR